ncbi:hypothetical protein BDR26DRAFT_872090 [Obelidium mucronatum]|nr:hypothetical protein BDR26DRAFT_872090 [Obelidium mucronatum]
MFAQIICGKRLNSFIHPLNLLFVIKKTKLTTKNILAVGFIHSIGVVHRDLKLNQNVVLIDFGFANKSKGLSPDGLLRTSCGSPCYAAPELVTTDKGYVGEAADLWSCGVILFSMIAGYLPYDDDPENPDGDNINLLYNYIMETKLEYPDYVPKDCINLINRILVPDPKYRAGIDEIMNHVWLKPVRHIFDAEIERRANLSLPTGPTTSPTSPASAIHTTTTTTAAAPSSDREQKRRSNVSSGENSIVGARTATYEQLTAAAAAAAAAPTNGVGATERTVSESDTIMVCLAATSIVKTIPLPPHHRHRRRTHSGPVVPDVKEHVVEDAMVVDEPEVFEDAVSGEDQVVLLPSSLSTTTAGAATTTTTTTTTARNLVFEPTLMDEEEDIVTRESQVEDLRGILSMLSSDDKSLPSTPSASPNMDKSKSIDVERVGGSPLPATSTTLNAAAAGAAAAAIASPVKEKLSFAEFMRRAVRDRPLPDLPVSTEVESGGSAGSTGVEPKGILRGQFTPRSDRSSRVSSGKKHVSILEPSLVVVDLNNRTSSRASWFSSFTSRLFSGGGGAGGVGKSGGDGVPASNNEGVVANGDTAKLSIMDRRNDSTGSLFRIKATPPRSNTISPPPEIPQPPSARALSPPPTSGRPTILSQLFTGRSMSRASTNAESSPGAGYGLSLFPRQDSVSQSFSYIVISKSTAAATATTASDHTHRPHGIAASVEAERRRTYFQWEEPQSPKPPPSNSNIQSGRATPGIEMSRAETVLSLSASDYHVHFANRSRGSVSVKTGASERLKVTKKMKVHVGNADVRALSRRDPETLLEDVKCLLEQKGLDVVMSGEVEVGEFRLKVVRPGRVVRATTVGKGGRNAAGLEVSVEELARFMDVPAGLREGTEEEESDVQLSPVVARTISRNEKMKQSPKMGRMLAGLPASMFKKLQYVKEYGLHYNTGFDPNNTAPVMNSTPSIAIVDGTEGGAAAESGSSSSATTGERKLQFLDEIVFYVELQKVAKVPGRFKRLYNELVEALPVV